MILGDLLQDQNPWWRDGAIRRARGYPVRRDLQPKILSRIQRLDDRRAMLLLGPRQVGKTVLLLQVADDLLTAGLPPRNLTYFDFSDDRITGEVTADAVVEAQPVGMEPEYPRVFLLDEIRSAPKWDLWLKRAVDSRAGRIVATDSAARLLRGGSQESGQGRWDELFIEGLSFREFVRLHAGPREEKEKLRLAPNLHERYLALGGFPEYVLSEDFPEVRRRLRSDIAERAILRDLSGLGVDVERIKDLFVYLLQDSGAELNAEARARDLAADPRSVREWVRLLADTLLVFPLDRFARGATAGLRSKSKIFAADPGLVMAFASFPVQDSTVRARAFEAAVFRHLREVARDREARLGYYRQREDLEIDFVLEDPRGEIVAIEVTSNPRLRADKSERLRRAAKELGADRRILIHGGVLDEEAEGVEAVPVQRFLFEPATCLLGGEA